MFSSFPLPALIVIAFNLIVFIQSALLDSILFSLPLPSGAAWNFRGADLLLTLALVCLYVEIFRATQTSAVSITNHALSLVVFVVCLVEFIVLPAFAVSTFFLIMLMCLIDVIAGFTVTIASARRDVEFR
jgi:hypothetical protein